MNRKRNILMLMITVALALAGCNRKTIYSHYEHTPIGGWEKVDHLSFTLSPVPESGSMVPTRLWGLR